MTDPDNRLAQSAPGPFFVDVVECIGCGNYAEAAPNNFSDVDDTCMVSKQPVTDEEKSQVRQAMDECPVSAIGECTGE